MVDGRPSTIIMIGMTKTSVLENKIVRASFAPIARRTLGDDVLETLRRAIITGEFAPGQHLAEGALAQELGVSRAPVREAMMQLEREGLLLFNKRGAALVKAFTEDDFEEIFTLRLTLETAGARFACRNFDASDAERLEESIARTQSAVRLLEVTLLDVEFHDLIMQAARHTRLYSCWNHLRHQIEVWLARMHSEIDAPTQDTREKTVRHHGDLLESLRSSNEEEAAEAMHDHIKSWGRQYPRSRVRNGGGLQSFV